MNIVLSSSSSALTPDPYATRLHISHPAPPLQNGRVFMTSERGLEFPGPRLNVIFHRLPACGTPLPNTRYTPKEHTRENTNLAYNVEEGSGNPARLSLPSHSPHRAVDNSPRRREIKNTWNQMKSRESVVSLDSSRILNISRFSFHVVESGVGTI